MEPYGILIVLPDPRDTQQLSQITLTSLSDKASTVCPESEYLCTADNQIQDPASLTILQNHIHQQKTIHCNPN